MLELYFMPGPNTWKVSIMLEECGIPYAVKPVNLLQGEQNRPDFLRISPNGRIPAILDPQGPEGSLAIFESGAILLYLAEKSGRFLARAGNERYAALQWVFWQASGLGPMAGQVHYYLRAQEQNPAALERYKAEVTRLYAVLEQHLAGREFIAGEYGIADMSCYGWIWFHNMHGQDLCAQPNIRRWFDHISARPAVRRGRALELDMLPDGFRGKMDGAEWPAG